jgi:hypothetical protein
MATDLLVHATGACALALNVFALVHRCERKLRLQYGLAGVVWALDNLLLGAHTAAALSLVSAGRTATSAATLSAAQRTRLIVFLAFIAVTLGVSGLTWQGWASALLALASLLSTVAMFYLQGWRLRLTMLLVSALWMHHAWSYGSWPQMIANGLTAAAALYGAWRTGANPSTLTSAATSPSRPSYPER